jgi:DNA (cytosine-5)-methyltransferase 1
VSYGVVTKGNGDAFLSEERHTALTAGGGQAGQGYPAAMVPYTMKIRSGCEGGGKGALIQEDKRATLATNNDQYLFQPMSPTFIIDNIGGQAEYGKASSVNGTLRAGAEPAKVSIGLNGESQVSPTLIARMSSAVGTTQDGLILCEEVTPIHDQATRFSGKRGDKADGKGNGLGIGEAGDPMNTLTGGDRHAVAYGLDRASFNQGKNAQFGFSVLEEQQPTLTAKGLGATCSNYIVRRLTPTECARLQGFADWWGVVEPKDTLTDEEYRFWLEVRNTHARINGKKVQDYTAKQMLTWYNKLWTDSAEYKMWGNGIALPTALYCVQGVVEALIPPHRGRV